MFYYLQENNTAGVNAGTKDRNDVEKILFQIKGKPIQAPKAHNKLPHGNRLIFYIKLKKWLKEINSVLPLNSYLFLQYPLMTKFDNSNDRIDYTYLFPKLANKYKLIVLIHDLPELRNISKRNSINDLKKADYIISHNEEMTNFLCGQGISKDKIVDLNIFDYLISQENISDHYEDKNLICFAGNLEKSQFIYKLPKNVLQLGVNLYGTGYKGNHIGLNYKGTYSSEKIHSVIRGRYGLIWDGDSIKTCSGILGEYMRYNNPHKMSMYFVANMPVVVWKYAAAAKFVKKYKVGIVVDNLNELSKLNNIDRDTYNEMVNNVKKLKSKLMKGYFLKTSLGEINSKMEDKTHD